MLMKEIPWFRHHRASVSVFCFFPSYFLVTFKSTSFLNTGYLETAQGVINSIWPKSGLGSLLYSDIQLKSWTCHKCCMHTGFHTLNRGTCWVNLGLSFIHKLSLCISNNLLGLTQFGQNLDLGRCCIQVFI